jgi:NAD-dependent DNA ligase
MNQRLNIDDHEDIIRLYNLPLMQKRAIQELHGIAAAIIYDGTVSDEEIGLIASWLLKHRETHNAWPVSRLIQILDDIFKDNTVTPDERKELLAFLGGIAADPESGPTVCNIFTPDPRIVFPDRHFMFTGNLQFGKRSKAHAEVKKRQGFPIDGSYKLFVDYLVVGELGQEAWKYGRYGTKIEKCVNALEARKACTAILRESDFVKAIIDNPV